MFSQIEVLESCIAPAAFIVTTTANSGLGSLRAAITDANATDDLDTITFAIPGAGVHTIAPTSALPTIEHAVKILGNTQSGYAGKPLIEIDGSFAGANASGLRMIQPETGSKIRALAINDFDFDGIQLIGVSNTTVVGCYIGVDPTGRIAHGNGAVGIRVASFAHDVVIGGDTANERNVISANAVDGVLVSQAENVVIRGNYIGTNVTGKSALGNTGNGIEVSNTSSNITIGGLSANEGNVISANSMMGIAIINTGSVQVFGNKIGTDKAGAQPISNQTGIEVRLSSGEVTIGSKNAPNVISGNTAEGVRINDSSHVTLRGNFIGTGAGGVGSFGNGGDGVRLEADSTGNEIGRGNLGNVIAHNGGAGIAVVGDGSTGNLLAHNKFFVNGGLAIDLGDNGITPDDFLDADSGPNNLLNAPFVTSVTETPNGGYKIKGFLSTPESAAGYVVEFYLAATDPTNRGEGKGFLGRVFVPSGSSSFTFKTTRDLAGRTVTALVHDKVDGSTSEFSVNQQPDANV